MGSQLTYYNLKSNKNNEEKKLKRKSLSIKTESPQSRVTLHTARKTINLQHQGRQAWQHDPLEPEKMAQ